jgi:hypothetical protein
MTLRRTNDLITPFASEISGSVSIREPEASFTDNTSRVFLYRAVWSCEYRRGKWEMSSALKINAVSDESRVQLLIDIDRTHIWYAMQAFSANYNP